MNEVFLDSIYTFINEKVTEPTIHSNLNDGLTQSQNFQSQKDIFSQIRNKNGKSANGSPSQRTPKRLAAIIDEWDTVGSTYYPKPQTHEQKAQLSAIQSLASFEDKENVSVLKNEVLVSKKQSSENLNSINCTSLEAITIANKSAQYKSNEVLVDLNNNKSGSHNNKEDHKIEFPFAEVSKRNFRIRGASQSGSKVASGKHTEFKSPFSKNQTNRQESEQNLKVDQVNQRNIAFDFKDSDYHNLHL